MMRVSWDQLASRIRWRQGEHVALIGPTGVGKTTVISRLIPQRDYAVVLGTKRADPTLTKEFKGFTRIDNWPPKRDQNRVLLWPQPEPTLAMMAERQRAVFTHALNNIYTQGGWAVVFDEVMYLTDELKLGKLVSMYHYHARSANITIVDGFQRPAWIPRIVYSSASHLFVWKTTDTTDIRTLTQMVSLGASERGLLENMRGLSKHEFMYINTRVDNTVPVVSSVRM